MRVVVVGATGNIGSSLVRALLAEDAVTSIVGVARRRPVRIVPGVEYRSADIVRNDLDPILAGADVVVHLAWAIQPSHDLLVGLSRGQGEPLPPLEPEEPGRLRELATGVGRRQ